MTVADLINLKVFPLPLIKVLWRPSEDLQAGLMPSSVTGSCPRVLYGHRPKRLTFDQGERFVDYFV